LAIVLTITLILTFIQAPTYQSSVRVLTETNTASQSIIGDIGVGVDPLSFTP